MDEQYSFTLLSAAFVGRTPYGESTDQLSVRRLPLAR